MPLRVAVIGCGRFGSMVAAQVLRAPGMELSVVSDLDVGRALEVLRISGRDPGDATVASKVGEANDAMAAGTIAVTGDPGVAVHSEVDVVVEATGNPDAGARHIYEAIMDDRHVVNVTVEADVLVGHLLKGDGRQGGRGLQPRLRRPARQHRRAVRLGGQHRLRGGGSG